MRLDGTIEEYNYTTLCITTVHKNNVHVPLSIVNSYVKYDGIMWLYVINHGFGYTTEVNKYKYNSVKLSL